ncbi:MAG: D-2-hydroxyacid dehydrogenase [Treponema sp.]|nr:D-2-hydroxyacid dehydrogenase [Treponema sp.]
MKIVILDGYTENPGDLSWEGFERLGELTVYDRTANEEEAISRITGADIIITNKTPIPERVIASNTNLKYIGVLATGYNVVDTKAARERGIPVTNIPTYGTDAVGQFAIALLLEICHRVGHHDNAVKEGRWEQCSDFCFWDFPLIELAGKTMGIIGFGRIGQCTGRIARALGMEVIAYDEAQSDEAGKIAAYVSLEELYARSDIISLHCPLFPETQGMINRENIAKMKDGVIIINTSRGPLIVEQELADALNSGKVYAAAVDVVSIEPIRGDNPLLKAKNCIITPHIAWAPKESRSRLMDIAVGNLQAFLDGKPVNVVN